MVEFAARPGPRKTIQAFTIQLSGTTNLASREGRKGRNRLFRFEDHRLRRNRQRALPVMGNAARREGSRPRDPWLVCGLWRDNFWSSLDNRGAANRRQNSRVVTYDRNHVSH